MKVSIIINCDTRKENGIAETMFNGTVNEDYLIEGIENKIRFFDGFEKEVIIHVDEHNQLSQEAINYLIKNSSTLIIRKHTSEHNFNDWNYIRAIGCASGEILVHFDQDSNAFARNKEEVEKFIGLLDKYDFISYPSWWSPLPTVDDSFDHTWVSTRFFMCKRASFDLSEIAICQENYDYWRAVYPVKIACHWLEHLMGSIAKYRNQTIYYPPMDLDNIIIFSWGRYENYTLKKLNHFSFEEVKQWVLEHPIQYPNDIFS